jgi:hypothetical protein
MVYIEKTNEDIVRSTNSLEHRDASNNKVALEHSQAKQWNRRARLSFSFHLHLTITFVNVINHVDPCTIGHGVTVIVTNLDFVWRGVVNMFLPNF